MQTQSDTDLLRDYAENKSEAAFGEIVQRYADLVYSAALRQVGDAELARDVAQIVFADLARKAGALRANTLLIGWLYRGAHLAALEELRNNRRRLERERQAMDLLNSSPEIPADWNTLRPVLDEAIATLGNEERDALLLRFFKEESLASIVLTLGISEDAAQKRVSRALSKLRESLAQRGIHTAASALSAALTSNAVQAAPPGFAASLAAGALAKAAVAGGSSVPFLKLFTLTNMKTAMLVLVLAGGIGSLAVLQRATQRQLLAAQSAAQRQAAEIAALRAANDQLANQGNELERLRLEAKDIPRLRGTIAQLLREKAAQKSVTPQVAETEANSSLGTNGPPILITAKFISVPTESLKTFGWAQAIGGAGEIGFMADSQVRSALQDLQTVEGTEILSSPRVTTGNSMEASLFAGEMLPFGGTNAAVGVSLHVNPHYSTNSLPMTLDLAAELSQLIDTSSQQDDSQPDLRATTITNSVRVLDGQTVVLRQDISGEGRVIGSTNLVAGPKSLLVFLTPQIIRDGYVQRLESVVQKK